MSPYTASEPTDNSGKYPKTYEGEGVKTPHKSIENEPIEIVEELGEFLQVGKTKSGRYVLILNDCIHEI